jgi:hypothetical protein
VEIDQGQHGQGAVGVPGKAPQTLEDEKRMFDLGPDFRFLPVGSLVGVAQGPVSIGAFIGEVFRPWRPFPEPLSLFLAPVGAVAMEAGFVSKEKIRHFVTVMNVGRGAPANDFSAPPLSGPHM